MSSIPAGSVPGAPFDAEAVGRAEAFARAQSNRPPLTAVVGFDGFVDEIIDVVDQRTGPDRYTPIRTIAAFADRVARAAGLSTNLELVQRQLKLGGNGPIMSNALVAFGAQVTYVGSLGQPDVHPVFQEMAGRCVRTVSIAAPGHTDALEFQDGKVMLGKLESLKEVSWESLTRRVPVAQWIEALRAVDLLAMVNWTMLPALTEIWQRMLAEVLPQAASARTRPLFAFFDLSDPEKRPRAELRAALATVDQFGRDSRAMLGLNFKEALQVAAALDLAHDAAAPDRLAVAIATALPHLYGVVVHPAQEAAACLAGKVAHLAGPYTASPRLTTGAGDNFNAGFCLGAASGLDPGACLAMGTATSGFYVRQARSPSLGDLARFLGEWRSGRLAE